MKKTTQFIVASILAVVGIVFLFINRFSASADSLISIGQRFSIIAIIGLVLLAIAAFWFFRLSTKD